MEEIKLTQEDEKGKNIIKDVKEGILNVEEVVLSNPVKKESAQTSSFSECVSVPEEQKEKVVTSNEESDPCSKKQVKEEKDEQCKEKEMEKQVHSPVLLSASAVTAAQIEADKRMQELAKEIEAEENEESILECSFSSTSHIEEDEIKEDNTKISKTTNAVKPILETIIDAPKVKQKEEQRKVIIPANTKQDKKVQEKNSQKKKISTSVNVKKSKKQASTRNIQQTEYIQQTQQTEDKKINAVQRSFFSIIFSILFYIPKKIAGATSSKYLLLLTLCPLLAAQIVLLVQLGSISEKYIFEQICVHMTHSRAFFLQISISYILLFVSLFFALITIANMLLVKCSSKRYTSSESGFAMQVLLDILNCSTILPFSLGLTKSTILLPLLHVDWFKAGFFLCEVLYICFVGHTFILLYKSWSKIDFENATAAGPYETVEALFCYAKTLIVSLFECCMLRYLLNLSFIAAKSPHSFLHAMGAALESTESIIRAAKGFIQ